MIKKIKSILFSNAKNVKGINISFAGHWIKQHDSIEYFGSQLGSILSEKVMASKVLNEIHVILKFLYKQVRYLTPVFRRL